MKKLLLLWLISALCFSCGEEQGVKRTYTEKDIEGYWATYTALHPSTLADNLALGNDSITTPFIRLYNDVNGFPDSTYKVRGDSIFIRICTDPWFRRYEYKFTYLIRFASKERLELCEFRTGQFLTYYSVLSLPEVNVELKQFEIGSVMGGPGFLWSRDSLNSVFRFYEGRTGCYFGRPREIHVVTQSSCFEKINELYRRIDRRNMLLEWYVPHKPGEPPPVSGPQAIFESDKHYDIFHLSNFSVDPCLHFLLLESDAVMDWIHNQ